MNAKRSALPIDLLFKFAYQPFERIDLPGLLAALVSRSLRSLKRSRHEQILDELFSNDNTNGNEPQ